MNKPITTGALAVLLSCQNDQLEIVKALMLSSVKTYPSTDVEITIFVLDEFIVEFGHNNFLIESRDPETIKPDEINHEVSLYLYYNHTFTEGLFPEYLDRFDLNCTSNHWIDFAMEDGGHEVSIWIEENYPDSLMATNFFLRNEDRKPKIFKSYEQANAWITEQKYRIYILDNNEIARPDYYITKAVIVETAEADNQKPSSKMGKIVTAINGTLADDNTAPLTTEQLTIQKDKPSEKR